MQAGPVHGGALEMFDFTEKILEQLTKNFEKWGVGSLDFELEDADTLTLIITLKRKKDE